MGADLALKFWGTRGIISSPRLTTAVFGGNTSSIQILHGDDLVVVDTGFGVSNLGEELMAEILSHKKELTIHLFFTQYHWDHIQGLPFFHPIYFPSTKMHIYAPTPKQELHDILDLLFDGTYSPFAGIDNMPSKITFHQLTQPMTLDSGLTIKYLELPQEANTSCSYRFESSSRSIVIATDHEAVEGEVNNRLLDFAKKASILVHDAHFSDAEYLDHVGWGHSSISQALDNGRRAKAKKTILTHHAPHREDQEIGKLLDEASREKRFKSLDFLFAREGEIYR